MWEKIRVLEHETDPTPVHWKENTALHIDKDFGIQNDTASARPQQSGDEIESQRFAGTRLAKECDNALAIAESDIEVKSAYFEPNIDLDHLKTRDPFFCLPLNNF